MMNHNKNIKCPHCAEISLVSFTFYNPNDGDCEYAEVTCKCGCRFEVGCIIEIDPYYRVEAPEIISLPEKEEVEEEEKYVSRDPNQITFTLANPRF